MISVSIGNLVPPALLAMARDPEGITRQVLRDVATSAATFWRNEAKEKLGSSGADYADAVQAPEYLSDTRVQIVLLGRLPNMIEGGWPGGDQRQWLCGPGSENRKPIYRKNEDGSQGEIIGWYNTIPFRWSFGGKGQAGKSVASLFGMPDEMSRAQSYDFFLEDAEAKAMADDIYSVAKRLSATTTDAFGPYVQGERRETMWGDSLPAGMAPTMPGHTTDPLAGMIRKETTYERSTQSQYMTFRRISDRKDIPQRGWIHPGITARHFATATQEHVTKVSRRALMAAIRRSMRAA